MANRRKSGPFARVAAIGFFSCVINSLAAGCHESLDLSTDEVDAAVRLRADGGTPDAAEPPPSRVPPDPCKSDSDCTAARGVCATDLGVCVECTLDDQCRRQSPFSSVCSRTRHICVVCETDSDCGRFSFLSGLSLHCRQSQCAECAADGDCPTDRPYCETKIGFCEQCQTTDQCPQGNACVSFVPNSDFPRRCQPTG